jgi:hypothetical protein
MSKRLRVCPGSLVPARGKPPGIHKARFIFQQSTRLVPFQLVTAFIIVTE